MTITLRVVAGMLPALAGSIMLGMLAPIAVLVSVAALYRIAAPMQSELFTLSPGDRYWRISVPILAFFLAWALLLAVIGKPEQIGRSVGAMAMAAAVAVWPVYMSDKAYARKARSIPLPSAYGLAAAIIVLQQVAVLGGSL